MKRKTIHRRRGNTSIEVVGVTGIMVPVAGFLLVNGLRICRIVYATIVNAAAWPFM